MRARAHLCVVAVRLGVVAVAVRRITAVVAVAAVVARRDGCTDGGARQHALQRRAPQHGAHRESLCVEREGAQLEAMHKLSVDALRQKAACPGRLTHGAEQGRCERVRHADRARQVQERQLRPPRRCRGRLHRQAHKPLELRR